MMGRLPGWFVPSTGSWIRYGYVKNNVFHTYKGNFSCNRAYGKFFFDLDVAKMYCMKQLNAEIRASRNHLNKLIARKNLEEYKGEENVHGCRKS